MANSIFTKVNHDEFDEPKTVIALTKEKDVVKESKEEGDEVKCKFCWSSDVSL